MQWVLVEDCWQFWRKGSDPASRSWASLVLRTEKTSLVGGTLEGDWFKVLDGSIMVAEREQKFYEVKQIGGIRLKEEISH